MLAVPDAPTTTVLPLMASDAPKLSPAAPSVSVAFRDQLGGSGEHIDGAKLLLTEPAATSVLPFRATSSPNQ